MKQLSIAVFFAGLASVAGGVESAPRLTPGMLVRLEAARILNQAFPGQASLLETSVPEGPSRQEKLDAEMLMAAKYDHFDKMQTLLVAGARIDAVDMDGGTALMWAAWHRRVWAVELLLSRGARVDLADERGRTALMHAAALSTLGDGARTMALLLAKGADVNAQDEKGATALYLVCDHRYESTPDLARFLLNNGAQADRPNDLGRTPLMAAAKWGHLDVVKTLLPAGADQAAKDKKGVTALMLAVEDDRGLMVGLLISLKGSDLNAKDSLESTALMRAAKTGSTGIIKALIDGGADKNAPGSVVVDEFELEVADHTPLMVASRFARVEAVKALIAKGADLNYRERHHGRTALGIAKLYGGDRVHQEIVKILSAAGAKE